MGILKLLLDIMAWTWLGWMDERRLRDKLCSRQRERKREREREREILDLAKVQSDKSFVFMKPWQ